MMDELYMMGDDPSAYLSPPETLAAPLISTEKVLMAQSGMGDNDDVIITNSTNQMLDVVHNNNNNSNKRQRKGNRRQNNQQQQQQQQRNRNRNNNNQNDGTSFDDNNPINVISAFNRTGKIYNKLRKNDAVKVIDTPSGRAGFVYQSGTGGSSGSGSSSSNNNANNNNQDSPMSTSFNKESSNWDEPYPQNQFVNRNANDVKLIPSDDTSNKKILPVLTADGKIALVVRGDTSRYFDENQNNGSGNSINSKKYEPITNLTSIITALNSNNDNNNFNSNNNKHNDSINVSDGSADLKTIQEENRLINRLDEFFASVTNKVKHIEEELEEKLGIDLDEDDGREKNSESDDEGFQIDPATTTTTTIEPFIDEDEDKDRKDLLLINRPLSEVLGLPKKTHYHHPHDPMHTSPTEVPYTRQSNENRKTHTVHRTSSTNRNSDISTTITTTTSTTTEEFDLESPEKINIAVIPRFDSELEERLFGKNRETTNRNSLNTNEIPDTSGAISSIHCAMEVMIALACAFTIFGVLGAYYRTHIVNQIRTIYW